MTKTKVLGIVGVLLVATACVACGGDDEGGASDAPAASGPGGSSGETTPAPTSFELEAKGDAIVRRKNGGNVELRVKGGAAVSFEIDGLPAGVSAQATSIPAGATDAAIKLSYAGDAPPFGEHTIKVRGKSSAETHEISLKLFVADDAGAMDATFGNKGIFSGQTGPGGPVMAIDREGRTVLAGTNDVGVAFLSRYTADGAPDSSFDLDGTMTLKFDMVLKTLPTTIQPRSDGALFVGGARLGAGGKNELCVAKLDDAGKGVPGFGAAGIVCLPHPGLGESAMVSGLVHREDGSILATGICGSAMGPKDLFVLAITATGGVDTTFGTAGLVRWKLDLTDEMPQKILIDAEGRILVGGVSVDQAAQKNSPFVLRLLKSGEPDAWYGKGGMSIIDRPGAVMGMTLGPKGEVYLAGMEIDSAAQAFTGTIYALEPEKGAPLATFGKNGVVELANAGFMTIAWDDGKLLAGGGSIQNQVAEGLALRVSATDGALDPTYANNGKLALPMGASVKSLSIAPSSRAIMLLTNANPTFVVARTWR